MLFRSKEIQQAIAVLENQKNELQETREEKVGLLVQQTSQKKEKKVF